MENTALDLTDPEENKIIQEKNLFRTRCPELVRGAAQILEEMISEMGFVISQAVTSE